MFGFKIDYVWCLALLCCGLSVPIGGVAEWQTRMP